MGAAAAVSRAFGGLRVLVVGAVLGTTYLGNAFQGSNQISTVLFELLAAGALSAVLVPTFVGLLDTGDRHRAEEVAGGVLGTAFVALGVVAVLGVLAAPWLAGLLTSGIDDPTIAADQEALTTTLLRFFIPQVLLYALGAVATAVLNAQRVFAIPAAAPIANTIVMVAFLAWFRVVAGPDPGLDLSTGETLLLAAAGTLGVAAFIAVPTVALRAQGFRLRPRWATADPDVRRLLGLGTWATLQHASAALLLGAAIVVGGAVEGAVVAFQFGWFLFLAPYGVLAQPIQTAVLPELANAADDRRRFSRSMQWALGSSAALLLPVTAVFVVLAEPLADLLAFGQAREGDGIELIAAAIASLGTGLLAYGAYLLFARAFYALGDSRTPAIVSLAAAAVGVAVMVVAGRTAEGPALVAWLGVGHTVGFLLAAVVLGVQLARRAQVMVWTNRLLVPVALSSVSGVLGALLLAAWSPDGRPASLAAVAVIGGLVAGSCLLAARWAGLLTPRPDESPLVAP
jgi:putative peptidoglycan lipid II flippase